MNNFEKQIHKIIRDMLLNKIMMDKAEKKLKTLFTESVLGLESMKEATSMLSDKETKSLIKTLREINPYIREQIAKGYQNELRSEIKQELLGGKA